MNDRLDKALGLMNRVFRAIAKKPDELRINVERSAGVVEVTLVANPADTRRLVGKGADTLKQLAILFRLLARDSGRAVRLCDLIPNRNPEPPFEPYSPNPEWPREEVEALLRDLTEAVFEAPVIVTTEAHTDFSVKMYASVQADLEGNRALGVFDKAVNVIFIPVGTGVGMKVYAHVHDWKKVREGTATASGR